MHLDMSQRYVMQKFAGERHRRTVVRSCAVKMLMDMSEEPTYAEIYRSKAADQDRAPPVLCQPAQSKCTWVCHKKHNRPQTQSKPNPRGRLCASLRSRNARGHLTRASLERFCADIYRKKGGIIESQHLDRTPALTPTITTPQCGPLFGESSHVLLVFTYFTSLGDQIYF